MKRDVLSFLAISLIQTENEVALYTNIIHIFPKIKYGQ